MKIAKISLCDKKNQDLLDNTFLEECETILGKVAKAIHENLNSFGNKSLNQQNGILK